MTRFCVPILICVLFATGATGLFAANQGSGLHAQGVIGPRVFQHRRDESNLADETSDPELVRRSFGAKPFRCRNSAFAGESGRLQVREKAARNGPRKSRGKFSPEEWFDAKSIWKRGRGICGGAGALENKADHYLCAGGYNNAEPAGCSVGGRRDRIIPPDTFRGRTRLPGRQVVDYSLVRFGFIAAAGGLVRVWPFANFSHIAAKCRDSDW